MGKTFGYPQLGLVFCAENDRNMVAMAG
jgi:hypothetical protein